MSFNFFGSSNVPPWRAPVNKPAAFCGWTSLWSAGPATTHAMQIELKQPERGHTLIGATHD
jgi:hypothetical protein